MCTDRGRQIRQRREGKKKKNRKVKKTAAASKPKSHKAPAAAQKGAFINGWREEEIYRGQLV